MDAKEMKLMNLLRWLYDETRNDFVKISMIEKAKEYELPQNGTICTQLFKLGILKKKSEGASKNYYKWNLEEAPTPELVTKIINAVAEYWRNKPAKKKKSIEDKKGKVPDTTSHEKGYIEVLSEKLSTDDIINLLKLKGIHGKLTVSKTIEI